MQQMKTKPHKIPTLFEPLEPRLLLSAGLEGVLAAETITSSAAALETPQIEQAESDTLAASNMQAEENSQHELVILDTGTPDYQLLVDDLLAGQSAERNIDIFYLDSSLDGIEQISNVLSGYHNLDTVHIISHGSQQGLQLGSTSLQLDTLAQYAPAIEGWGTSLEAQGDLLLYGCDLAGSDEGVALINALSQLTGVDVAASDDLTGNAHLGGDWELEYHTGNIESEIALSLEAQQNWEAVLLDDTAPAQVNNTGSMVAEDGTDLITNLELRYDDDQQPATSVNYTVTSGPANGQLELTTAPAIAITSFTQDDINGNRLVYVHDGSETTDDGFAFTVDDGIGNTLAGQSFSITVEPANDSPVNTVPGPQTTDEDTVLVFSSAGGNSISVGDNDAGSGLIEVTLTATNGSVTLGIPMQPEVITNTTTADDQQQPRIAMALTGEYVVVWASASQDGSGSGIYGQLYDATGNPLGGEFQANTTTANDPGQFRTARHAQNGQR